MVKICPKIINFYPELIKNCPEKVKNYPEKKLPKIKKCLHRKEKLPNTCSPANHDITNLTNLGISSITVNFIDIQDIIVN